MVFTLPRPPRTAQRHYGSTALPGSQTARQALRARHPDWLLVPPKPKRNNPEKSQRVWHWPVLHSRKGGVTDRPVRSPMTQAYPPTLSPRFMTE